MKCLMLIFLLSINLQSSIFCQNLDSIPPKLKYNVFGIEILYSNLLGAKENEFTELSYDGQRFSLVERSSLPSLGVHFAFETRKNKRFSISPEIGLTLIRGKFITREYSGGIGITGGTAENPIIDRYDLTFNNLYFQSSYQFRYSVFKKANFHLVLTPRLAIQLLSDSRGNKVASIFEHQKPTSEIGIYESESGSIEYEFNLSISFLKYGIQKDFEYESGNILKLKIEYHSSFFSIFPSNDLTIEPLSISFEYGFLKTNK